MFKLTTYIGIKKLIFNKNAVKNSYFEAQDLVLMAV